MSIELIAKWGGCFALGVGFSFGVSYLVAIAISLWCYAYLFTKALSEYYKAISLDTAAVFCERCFVLLIASAAIVVFLGAEHGAPSIANVFNVVLSILCSIFAAFVFQAFVDKSNRCVAKAVSPAWKAVTSLMDVKMKSPFLWSFYVLVGAALSVAVVAYDMVRISLLIAVLCVFLVENAWWYVKFMRSGIDVKSLVVAAVREGGDV